MVWWCVSVAALALVFFGRDWLRSLRVPRRRRAGPRPAAVDSLPGMTAQWLLVECGRLAQAGAAWSDLSATIDPHGDSHVEALLGRIRAAHSGETLPMLKAIQAACQAALAENEAASAFDALSIAARNSPWTSSAKW